MSFILSLLVYLTCLQPGWGQCNGTALVIQLELFTKVYIQSPGFQERKYPQNLSCAWRFDRSRNTSEIIFTFHHKGMGTTPDSISLYGGVNDTGIKLIDTTENQAQDSTTRHVVDYSSLFLLFTTDNVESNDGAGFEMYILESQDYSGTDCLTTKQIQPKSTTQYLTSPNFPQKYPRSKICEWNITTADEVVVKVIFMDVERHTSTTCYDYVTIGDSKRLCADWEFNIDTTYVFNDSFLITFKSDDQVEKRGFVLSYVESKDNTTKEQTSIKPEVETTTNIELSTTQQSTSNTETTTDKLSPSQYSTSIAQTSTAETEILSTPLPDSTTNIPPGWGQCNGTTLVIQLELFTKVYIQSPGFQEGKYPPNLSCAWRFDCSRNTSEIIYTFHHKGMVNTLDIISLYGGVNDTGINLIDTTDNLSQDSTTRLVMDYSSLFLLFTTDNVESNDGYGVEMYILESQDYSGTDCVTTKQIQPKSTTQYLTSPNFPQKYPLSKTCKWKISTADEVVVKVIFMDVEPNPPTCYDYVTIGDHKRLCADWEYNIDTTYVFNDSCLITFKSDVEVTEQGFVLSYVERYGNTTEEQTSMTTGVKTTTNIELSTPQKSTSNTETTADDSPTTQYSTSNTETTTDDSPTSQYSTSITETTTDDSPTSQYSTSITETTTDELPTSQYSTLNTETTTDELPTSQYLTSNTETTTDELPTPQNSTSNTETTTDDSPTPQYSTSNTETTTDDSPTTQYSTSNTETTTKELPTSQYTTSNTETTNDELPTSQYLTSNTETTTDELPTPQYSTSNTETTTDDSPTTQYSTSNTETTADELTTSQYSTLNTETTTDKLPSSQYSTSNTETTTDELPTSQYTTSNTEATTDELPTSQYSTSNTETTTGELPTSQYSTSNTETTTGELPTSQYSTSNTETTTDKLSPSQYSTLIAQISTAERETLSTPLPDSTTNIPPGEKQKLSKEIVTITVAASAVVCILILIIIVFIFICKRRTSRKYKKYPNNSTETIDTKTTEVPDPLRWIQMIDRLYDLTFLECEIHQMV